MLNLIQHLTKSTTYETLKSETLNLIQGMVQGDRLGLFTSPLKLAPFPGYRGQARSESILFIFPQPEESDYDQKNGQKVGLDKDGKSDMNGVVPCSQDEDPDDRRHPSRETFSIAKKSSYPKGDDNPRPSLSQPIPHT